MGQSLTFASAFACPRIISLKHIRLVRSFVCSLKMSFHVLLLLRLQSLHNVVFRHDAGINDGHLRSKILIEPC